MKSLILRQDPREPPAATSHRAGRIALIAVGASTLLLGFLSLAGGGVLAAVHATTRDSAGFYATGTTTLTTPTHAFVSDELEIGSDGPGWLFRDGRLGTVRVTASGTADKPIFVGIARQSRVDSYFSGVSHAEVTDFETDPFSVSSTRRAGTTTPAAPTAQSFWTKSATGGGQQTLTWPVQKGSWAVVVMNADGSRGVQTGVSVGAKAGLVLWLGVGLLTVGGIFAAGGGALIFFGTRRPRGTEPPAETAPTATPVGDPA